MAESDARPLPVAIEEINSQWLTTAMRTRVPEAGVQGCQVLDVIHGTCTKIRLRLDVNEAGRRAGIPERVILKGGFEPHSRDTAFMLAHEVNSYRELFPRLPLNTPVCYFADFDAERRQGIIIMEDLVARGVSFCNPLVPQTRQQVAQRLSVLASFHARTWNTPEFAPGGLWAWVPEMLPVGRGYFNQFLVPAVWARFVAAPRGAAASVYFHDMGWMSGALDRLIVLAARLPHAVLHGDTHLGNLYEDKDGTPGFFDPTAHRWPPIEEVAYHLGCALDPRDRRRWERELVQHYLDELRRHGIEPPPIAESMRHYAAFLAFGYCIFLINESHYQPEAVNTAYVARFSAAMIDNDTAGALESIA
jgi:hypothetical protein